jgi:hypothetical protein
MGSDSAQQVMGLDFEQQVLGLDFEQQVMVMVSLGLVTPLVRVKQPQLGLVTVTLVQLAQGRTPPRMSEIGCRAGSHC